MAFTFLYLLIISLSTVQAIELKPGDVLLQSMNCRLCKLIEQEEHSQFSHVGVFVYSDHEPKVLQALQKVEMITLSQFLSFRTSGTETYVLRAVSAHQKSVKISNQKLLSLFFKNYANLNYDEKFLWDNKDEKGELLYCSEFVAKLLNHILPVKIAPKPMHYILNRDDWMKYFQGNPPDQLPGISPEDLYRSNLFTVVGKFTSAPTQAYKNTVRNAY